MAGANWVTPTGEILAVDHHPRRGAWLGNRGNLHDGGRTVVRPWKVRAWITCRTEYKDWRAPQWEPNRYTALFFHDEAVALAAGHRPCAMCRRADFDDFTARFARVTLLPRRVDPIDRRLHDERVQRRGPTVTKRTHPGEWAALPDGTFVLEDLGPAVVIGEGLVRWSARHGYGAVTDRPRTGRAELLTPPSVVAVLQSGYPVQIDPAALGSGPVAVRIQGGHLGDAVDG